MYKRQVLGQVQALDPDTAAFVPSGLVGRMLSRKGELLYQIERDAGGVEAKGTSSVYDALPHTSYV